jgi:hypothetical protein
MSVGGTPRTSDNGGCAKAVAADEEADEENAAVRDGEEEEVEEEVDTEEVEVRLGSESEVLVGVGVSSLNMLLMRVRRSCPRIL